MLNRIISLIEKKKNELLKLESEDFNTGVTEMYVAVKEILDKHNEGCHVFISDKDFLDKQKAVSKEFLQECKEVADKYKKRSSTNVSKTETTDWIPVTERLPEKPIFGEDSYIVQQEHIYSPCTAYWDGNRWSDDVNNTLNDVIAWRYLPDRYEGE